MERILNLSEGPYTTGTCHCFAPPHSPFPTTQTQHKTGAVPGEEPALAPAGACGQVKLCEVEAFLPTDLFLSPSQGTPILQETRSSLYHSMEGC